MNNPGLLAFLFVALVMFLFGVAGIWRVVARAGGLPRTALQMIALAASIFCLGGALAALYFGFTLTRLQSRDLPMMRYELAPGGSPRESKEWAGKVTVLNYWATWCVPCRSELKTLARFQKEYASRGVQVVAVSDEEPAKVRAWLEKNPQDFPVGWLVDSPEGHPMRVRPITLLIDRENRVRVTRVGEQSYEQLVELVGLLL